MKIDDELQELKRKHPNHCKTLTVTDNNGVVRELIFPKALDLDRPKRPRTNFTADQLQILEEEFERNQYLVGKDRNELSKRLKLSETQVKIWFQNRRTKYKKDQTKDGDEIDEGTADAGTSNIDKHHNKSASPNDFYEPPAKRPPVKRGKKKVERLFDDDSLSCASDASSFLLCPESPELPKIQPPMLSNLALPPTLPALAGQQNNRGNQQFFTMAQPQPLLSPASLFSVLQQTGFANLTKNACSYSPPTTSSASGSSSDATLLQQKVCATLGVTFNPTSAPTPTSTSTPPFEAANSSPLQPNAKSTTFSVSSLLNSPPPPPQMTVVADHASDNLQSLAPFLFGQGQGVTSNRVPQTYWNFVMP